MPAPVIAAAGITAGVGLLQALMQQEAAKKAAEEERKMREAEMAAARLRQAEQNQLSTVQHMGQAEQSAIGNLMAALQRTAR